MSKLGWETPTYTREQGMDVLVEYSGTDPLYVGRAFPGAATSAAKWQIVKVTVDANSNPTSVRLADGTDDFKKVWDDRATYTYL